MVCLATAPDWLVGVVEYVYVYAVQPTMPFIHVISSCCSARLCNVSRSIQTEKQSQQKSIIKGDIGREYSSHFSLCNIICYHPHLLLDLGPAILAPDDVALEGGQARPLSRLEEPSSPKDRPCKTDDTLFEFLGGIVNCCESLYRPA